MPRGHYDPQTRHLSHADFVLYLLCLEKAPHEGHELVKRIRHRLPDRREAYALLRQLEREGRVTCTITATGGAWYEVVERPAPTEEFTLAPTPP